MSLVASVGEVAHATLKRHHVGVVDSVFDRSAYVIFNEAHLCIALSSIGRGPVNIVYSHKAQALPYLIRQGATIRFHHTDQTLRIDDVVIAQLAQACVYDYTVEPIQPDMTTVNSHRWCLSHMPIPSSGLFSLAAAYSNTKLTNRSACSTDLEVAPVKPATPKTPATAYDSALAQFVLPSLHDLVTWLCNASSEAVSIEDPPERICNLLGAGPGLTPSGDDLLAGVLLALRACGYEAEASKLWAGLQPLVHSRTNPISATLLEQAAQGRAGEFALEALIQYTCKSRSDTSELADLLALIGDTSGWDFLAGVVLVLDAVHPNAQGCDKLAGVPIFVVQ